MTGSFLSTARQPGEWLSFWTNTGNNKVNKSRKRKSDLVNVLCVVVQLTETTQARLCPLDYRWIQRVLLSGGDHHRPHSRGVERDVTEIEMSMSEQVGQSLV